MLRQIDIPPLWLGVSVALAWALSFLLAVPFVAAGLALIALGAALMGIAVVQMVLARTTFIPRRNPAALVSGGAFAISRNPIYLGDALILTGVILFWGALLALPLVPAFMWLITRRYILDEEIRLQAGFGSEYSTWAARTGRWFGPL
jgi:protein-S-isoprenylcysteine O-methyltransferase Ste14